MKRSFFLPDRAHAVVHSPHHMTFATVSMVAEAEPGWGALALHTALMLVLLALSGAFSGSETVLFSLSRVQLERAAASHNPFRRLAAGLMQRPKQTLLTILIANTTVNVLLFATSYVTFLGLAARAGAWVTPVAGAASILLVVVGGEVVPKVLAVRLAEPLAPLAATLVHGVGFVAGPLGRWIDLLVAEPFTRIVLGGRRRRHTEADLSGAELKALLELSRRSGALRAIEDTFLRQVVDLSTTRVADVMVPRVEMDAYDVDAPADVLRELIRRTRHKKIPVYERAPDNIIGLVYAKVLFLNPDTPLRQLVQPIRFVPALATCEHLLAHFRQTRTQLAIAVDEYGGVAGLVTLEDVLEQIVGELHDPEEQPDEPEIRARPDGTYDISGQLGVQYWIETFGLPQQTERVATLGGLVMARLGRAARVGDVVVLGNVELEVTRVQRWRIERLQLRLRAPVKPGGPPS